MGHTKPTREELKANAKAALDKLENTPATELDKEIEPGTPPADPSVPPTPPAPPALPSTPPADLPATSPAGDTPPADPPTQKSGEDDETFRKRYADSTREAQRMAASNRTLNQAIDEADQIPDPTSEQLKTEYPEWEEMTPTEQRLAKESLVSKQFRHKIAQAREKGRQIEKWQEKVDTFVDDPKSFLTYPDLEGKQEDFKEFANSPEYSNTPFALLVNAFLHEQATKKVVNKGEMFPAGTGGSNTPIKPPDDTISVAEGAALLKKDPQKWKKLAKAGKIKFE